VVESQTADPKRLGTIASVSPWLPRTEFAGRIILAVLFLIAAVPKILDPAGFAQDIANYDFLPPDLVNVAAVILPWVEAVAALALLSGFAVEGGFVLILGLLTVFLVALSQAWIRGLDIHCGCFGHSDEAVAGSVLPALIRDLLYIAFAVPLMVIRFRKISPADRAEEPAPRPSSVE